MGRPRAAAGDRAREGRDAAESAAVYRALATRPGRALAADPARHEAAGWRMLMDERPRAPDRAAIARWRGRIDAFALRARLVDAQCFARHLPDGELARRLFALLEQNRVEALGARRFAGMGANLAALAEERWIRTRPEGVIRGDAAAWIETFALLTRVPLKAPLPEAARASLSHRWRSWMSPREATEVEVLAGLLEDQDAFDAQARRVVQTVLSGASSDQRAEHAPAEAGPQEPGPPEPGRQKPGPQEPGTSSGADPDPAANVERLGLDGEIERAGGASKALNALPSSVPYRVQTTAFDTTLLASELYDAATLARGRAELDRRVGSHLSRIVRWAHRLQRKLLALQQRSWQFDCEEGVLDASRLDRVVTRPLEPLAYQQEADSRFPETVVTLLVDNSGSMRGVRIATAAVCAELLGRVLERCGVRTEILGFTTRCWHGGRARRQWVMAGCPAAPGRLTELCHIIYKSADEPWRRASHRLGAMLHDELLKENVDGEALLWACDRLRHRSERRRILVVICDGAPLDEATLGANDTLYLDRHLRAVIAGIERERSIELAAIGIGHDVTAYYPRALTLPDTDALEAALVGQLLELFETRRPGHQPGHRAG